MMRLPGEAIGECWFFFLSQSQKKSSSSKERLSNSSFEFSLQKYLQMQMRLGDRKWISLPVTSAATGLLDNSTVSKSSGLRALLSQFSCWPGLVVTQEQDHWDHTWTYDISEELRWSENSGVSKCVLQPRSPRGTLFAA